MWCKYWKMSQVILKSRTSGYMIHFGPTVLFFLNWHWLDKKSVSYSAFLFVFPFLPQHLRKQNLQVLMKRSMRSRTTERRKARTSRLWYWYQVSSCAWTLKCLAPLFLMVNSIQNTASSRGLIGLSWWMLDSRMAFSLYLSMRNVMCFYFFTKNGVSEEKMVEFVRLIYLNLQEESWYVRRKVLQVVF